MTEGIDFNELTPRQAALMIERQRAYNPAFDGGPEAWITKALQHFSNRGLQQARGGLREVLANQKDWSLRTFGPGKRTIGITKHIEKECAEVRENPNDLSEWVDIIILAMDGYWRAGGQPGMLLYSIIAKQAVNRERTYLKTNEDEPSEHVR